MPRSKVRVISGATVWSFRRCCAIPLRCGTGCDDAPSRGGWLAQLLRPPSHVDISCTTPVIERTSSFDYDLPVRNTTELRGEILAAARAEFAQYGLAGARVDRI